MSNNFDWSFNLSYSTYSTFKQSPLQFYFAKIVGAEPDTETYEIYGLLGNIVHNTVEEYIKNKRLGMLFDYKDNFNKLWDEFKIDDLKTINNHKVKKSDWFKHLENTVFFVDNYKLLNSDDVSVVVEEHLEYVDDDGLLIKGFVDVVIRNKVTGEVVFLDWKTNSSYSEEMHRGQRLFYSWMYYNIHGVIPKCVWVYVKGGKKYEDIFTADDIKEFSEEINGFKEFIIKNHDNIDAFEVGDYNSPFNEYKQACYDEYIRRNKEKVVEVIIKNNTLFFEEGGLPDNLVNIMDKKYSYFVEGYNFSEKFKKRLWDGKKHLFNFKKNTLPIGFIHSVQTLIDDYNNYYDSSIKLKFVDERDEKVLGKKLSVDYKKPSFMLRFYQNEALKVIFDKKIGVVHIGTGGGKTFLAAELFRQRKNRCLFIVNRVELLEQTIRAFEDYLGEGVVGRIIDGEYDFKGVTVASIQSIVSILKRRDDTSKELFKYLYNVNTVVFDEAQNVTDSNTYGYVQKSCVNADVIVGLSGTPYRSYKPSTLELNAVLGSVIFKKSTEELVNDGYLIPTKCVFFKMNNIPLPRGVDYHDAYRELIVENEDRNNRVIRLVKKYEGKKILIITKLVEHAKFLHDSLEGSFLITGGSEKVLRKQDFKEFSESSGGVLIGTHSIFSAGIDLPSLDIIVNVVCNKSSIITLQSVGRVMRRDGSKKVAYYVDFLDNGHKSLFNASNERIRALKDYGHEVILK